MSCRDKLYLVTSKDLVSLRTTQHETASPPCTPRKKQPSYATVGTGPREACLTSSYYLKPIAEQSTRASVFIFAYWIELETCRHVAIDHDRASFPRIEIRLRKTPLKPCRRNLQTTCCCNPADQPSQCTPARKSCLWHR